MTRLSIIFQVTLSTGTVLTHYYKIHPLFKGQDLPSMSSTGEVAYPKSYSHNIHEVGAMGQASWSKSRSGKLALDKPSYTSSAHQFGFHLCHVGPFHYPGEKER